MGQCGAGAWQTGNTRAESCLLLQKTTVLLSAAVPATRPHAVRLPRAAICDADRQKRPIGVLAAICNTVRLLATAAHGGREDRRGRYRAKQDRGHAGHSSKTVPCWNQLSYRLTT